MLVTMASNDMREQLDDVVHIRTTSPIMITHRHLPDICQEAASALVEANVPPRIFTRGGGLVRIDNDENNEEHYLRQMTVDMVVGDMGRSAPYVRMNKKGIVNPTWPPHNVAKDLIANPSPQFRPITGMIGTPVVRPDGSIFSTYGYDPITGRYLTQAFDLSVPTHPTQHDAEIGVAYVLDEVLCDFPFVDGASRANALATMLTVLLRPAINGKVPMALFDKPAAGTGASLIVDLIASITTGKKAAPNTAPNTEDEWRKKITSLLYGGTSLVLIDNITGLLKSASLSSVITSSYWEDRVLGSSRMIRMPNNAMFVGTGNNLLVEGDLARRSYWIRQDAKVVHPDQRSGWHHENIEMWVEEHRTEILSALLTPVRAWYEAGCPLAKVRTVGSFEPWAETVGSILAYAGVDDFLGNISEMHLKMDDESATWGAFLAALHRSPATCNGFTSRDIIDHMGAGGVIANSAPEEIADAAGSRRGGAAQRIGLKLKKQEDRQYEDGLRLTSVVDGHTKIRQWLVVGEKDADSGEKDADSRGYFAEG